MLERDDQYPPDARLNAELDAIAAAMARGAARRTPSTTGDATREEKQNVLVD
jgi:uncharacterized protein (UPF0276 family)